MILTKEDVLIIVNHILSENGIYEPYNLSDLDEVLLNSKASWSWKFDEFFPSMIVLNINGKMRNKYHSATDPFILIDSFLEMMIKFYPDGDVTKFFSTDTLRMYHALKNRNVN